jgi:hypothetical protein
MTITEKSNVFIALLHYPVYNKHNEVVTTAIKNLDIHDIARVCASYNILKYFIVNPLEKMQNVANRIIGFWEEGLGSIYNEDRKESIEKIKLFSTLDDVIENIKKTSDLELKIVFTTAKTVDNYIDYPDLKALINKKEYNYLILFGTGWGMTDEIMLNADYVLKPLQLNRYNHLSVRSAASIIIDRLLGI